MRHFLVLLAFAATAAHASDSSYFAEPVSCTGGPFGLHLPGSYDELRRLGALRDDRVLPGQIRPTPAAEQRELTFNGLRLTIVRTKLDPANYQIVSASVTSGAWKIAGPLRVGGLLPLKVADVDTRQFRGRGIVEFIGESKDVLRVQRSGRRISSITYLCHLR